MKKYFIFLSCLVLGASAFLAPHVPAAQPLPQRIVSLLPSATEILFALKAGDGVIGVTRFCRYPPEAQKKNIVGGLIDVNYEKIYSLKPDLIIVEDVEGDKKAIFEKMNIPTLSIDTRSVERVLESIDRIGEAIGEKEKASELTNRIQTKTEFIQKKVEGLPKPRVLITYLREVGTGHIHEVYIAGNQTYFNDLIKIAGGENVYQGSERITSPIVTAEGILAMNPDVIVEVMGVYTETNVPADRILKDWDMLAELDAYKNKRIHLMVNDYAGIPGPRLIKVIDDLARLFHPEINWDE